MVSAAALPFYARTFQLSNYALRRMVTLNTKTTSIAYCGVIQSEIIQRCVAVSIVECIISSISRCIV